MTAPNAARAEVAARVAASGTSFYWAMSLLPAARRAAMFAIYAFCRAVDDVVDGPGTAADKRAGLAEWRREIDRVYAGAPQTAIGRELMAAVRRFDLARADFLTVIDGMEMDAGAPIVAPPLAELELYCARVAGAVGLLSIRAFGAPPAEGRRVAESLGHAFQLTNILRDLAEDAALGRLYLPCEMLDARGIAARDPAAVLSHPKLPEVCDELAVRAERHFDDARAAMRACPRAAMRPARVMMAVYRSILRRLRARGWRRLTQPVSLSKPAKLLIALRHGLV
jgi:phytoene synthase